MDHIATPGYLRTGARERGGAALGAAAATVMLGALLILGLRVAVSPPQPTPLVLLDLPPDRPEPERKPPEPAHSRRPQGAPSPPNLRSEPTEIVSPPPVLPFPSPVAAAPVAGVGSAPSAGAADVPGPGTGAGGDGDGRGAGGDGDGGHGDDTPPRWRSGRLSFSDYPRALADAGIGGTVGVRYLVWTDGHVAECEVTRSSGNAEIDALTCSLIKKRFRFRPSRDSRGRPVPSLVVENHTWDVPPPAPEKPPARRRRFVF